MHAQAGLFTEVVDTDDRSVEQMVASLKTSMPEIDPTQVMPGTILEALVLHRLTYRAYKLASCSVSWRTRASTAQ